MARWLVETDRNGTKVYHDDTCRRCGGQGGLEQWRFTGVTCYECGGIGRSKVRVEKEYTPEYRAILNERAKKRQEKKDALRREKAQEQNIEFMEKWFSSNDSIFIIKGDTYEIKDELKTEGCRFMRGLGWISLIETTRDSWEVEVSKLVTTNTYGELILNDDEFPNIVDALIKSETPESNWQGEVGKRFKELELTVQFCASFEVSSYSGYGTEMMYVNNMVDDQGNVFVWKTTTCALEKGRQVTLAGTVKEHSEYREVKQTVLTRCKVK